MSQDKYLSVQSQIEALTEAREIVTRAKVACLGVMPTVHAKLGRVQKYISDQADALAVSFFAEQDAEFNAAIDPVVEALPATPKGWDFVETSVHDHDHPNTSDCKYLGADIWACGVIDNEPQSLNECYEQQEKYKTVLKTLPDNVHPIFGRKNAIQ